MTWKRADAEIPTDTTLKVDLEVRDDGSVTVWDNTTEPPSAHYIPPKAADWLAQTIQDAQEARKAEAAQVVRYLGHGGDVEQVPARIVSELAAGDFPMTIGALEALRHYAYKHPENPITAPFRS